MAVARRRIAAVGHNAVVHSRDSGRQWMIETSAVRPVATEATPLLLRVVPTTAWFQEIIGAIQRGIEFIFSWSRSTCAVASNPACVPPLDDITLRALATWKDRIQSSPYDSTNLLHEQQLMELWRRAFPNEPLEQRISKQWGELGFQGKDPATDFRGAGIYALTNLLHISQHYHSFFASLIGSSFPFAITSINLTNVLFEILGYGMRPSPHSHSRTRLCSLVISDGNVRDDYFCEAYCLLFWCFAEEWRRLKATYMQFPTVLTAARLKFCLLIDEIDTPSQLSARNARALDADLIRF